MIFVLFKNRAASKRQRTRAVHRTPVSHPGKTLCAGGPDPQTERESDKRISFLPPRGRVTVSHVIPTGRGQHQRRRGSLSHQGRRLCVSAWQSDRTVRLQASLVCVHVHRRPRSSDGLVICEPSRCGMSHLLRRWVGGGLSERHAGGPGRGGITRGGGVSSSPPCGS